MKSCAKMRLKGDSTFSVGINYNKVQVLNNLPFLKSDLDWEIWILFVFRLVYKLSGSRILKLKSDPNPSKLFFLICHSIISLCWALNFGSSACKQLSVHEQSEENSPLHRESQWCEEFGRSSEHSLGGCSLNTRLFAFCSGTVEHRGKLLNRVCLFRIPWAGESD